MHLTLTLPTVFVALTAISAAAADAAPCAPEIGAICIGDERIDEAALIEKLSAADIAVLGERHDNPKHHEIQARLVGALSPAGLAFEMVARSREDFANAARETGDDLAEAIEWEGSGWPDWSMYAPIFDAAPDAWIAGGGVPPDVLRRSVTEGAAAAYPEGAEKYGLNERLEQDVIDAMLKEQEVAHCNALPTAMLPGMVEAQQLRDAAFADAALRLVEAGHGPAVLITGNGHARADRGSPLYLRRAAPDLKVFSVGLIELDGSPTSAALFDAVVYTAPHDRGDPCEAFLKSREKG